MDINNNLEFSTNVTINIHNAKTMEVVKTIKKHNIVTSKGKDLIASLLGIRSGVDGISYFGIGTDNTPVSLSDTVLGSEVFRNILTDVVYSANAVTFKFFLSSTQANGNTLAEAGLFGNNATSSPNTGHLFAHVVHDPIVKNSSAAITYSWEISIS